LWSRTTKQASSPSTDQGGGKRRAVIARRTHAARQSLAARFECRTALLLETKNLALAEPKLMQSWDCHVMFITEIHFEQSLKRDGWIAL
jgi:hypothetical protein